MRTRVGWATLLAVVALVGLFGCDSDSESPDFSAGTGLLSVYYADTPGPVDHLMLKFNSLAIHSTAGQWVELPVADTSSVDLILAKDDPQFLKGFNIPKGDYNGIRATYQIQSFETGGNTCLPEVPLQGPQTIQVVVNTVVVTVDETGSARVVVDLPVISGECLVDGGTGTLTLGTARFYPLVIVH